MPKNITQSDQYALVYDDVFLHVLIVSPGLTIDTGLTTLTIRNSKLAIEEVIALLETNRRSVATEILEELENWINDNAYIPKQLE